MRQAKTKANAKSKLNESFAIEGRTKVQRKKKIMKSAINTHDSNLGELKGETVKERYVHMNTLINAENARLKEIARLEELAEKAKKESTND